MKNILWLSGLILLGCSPDKQEVKKTVANNLNKNIVQKDFQTIIDSSEVKGSILIYKNSTQQYFSNNFEWGNSSHLPASTFKIPNSIIALETGIVNADTSIIKWNGQPHRFKVWEQDLQLKQAFHYSCVPCYQDIAKKVGEQRMKAQLAKLQFGQMTLDSNTLTNFWLEGESKINQFQEIDFLKRLENKTLNISERTDSLMKSLMIITKNDSIELRGKTGWSNQDNIDNGWFVGYVKRQGEIYYFATNIEPKKGLLLSDFAKIRKEITYKALNLVY